MEPWVNALRQRSVQPDGMVSQLFFVAYNMWLVVSGAESSTRERPPGFRATVSICAQEDGRLERRVSGTQRHGTASTENKAQTMPEISVADFWVDDLSRLAGSPNDRSQYTQNFHSRIHDPVFLAIYGV